MKKLLFTLAAAALVLCGIALGLEDISAANARAEELQMLRTLLPGSEDFTRDDYAGEDSAIRSAWEGENGFVVETVAAGYAGNIVMLVGVSREGRVTGLVVRDMRETSGLGRNALTDHAYLAQFLNTTGQAEVDALSGATVTSRAVANCVDSAVAYVTGADIQSGATSQGG